MEYLKYAQSIPSEEGRQAEMALFRRLPEEAERILLQASPPLVYRAIKLNIELFKWHRALDLAAKYRTHVDTVLAYRARFMRQLGKAEGDPKFLQYGKEVRAGQQYEQEHCVCVCVCSCLLAGALTYCCML